MRSSLWAPSAEEENQNVLKTWFIWTTLHISVWVSENISCKCSFFFSIDCKIVLLTLVLAGWINIEQQMPICSQRIYRRSINLFALLYSVCSVARQVLQYHLHKFISHILTCRLAICRKVLGNSQQTNPGKGLMDVIVQIF